MSIGITGSSGVLGRLFVEKLNKNNIEYNCFDGDITSKKDVGTWIKNSELDSVIHLAAIVPIDIVNSDPIQALEVNFIGTHNLLKELYSKKNNLWFFYSSTSHVYDSSDRPLKESDLLKPHNLYAETKLLAENLLKYYEKISNINFCIGRIFSFYHKYQKKPFLYPSIMERLIKHDKNEELDLRGKNNIRDMINAEEVVDIIYKLYEKKFIGTINIGSGIGTSIEDFVKTIPAYDLKIADTNDSEFSSLIADTSILDNFLKNNE